MNFILYFIFRTFFMRLEFSNDKLILKKGLIFRRIHEIPFSSIVRITVKRTLPLRILRIKSAEIFTLNGRFKTFMRRDEEIPFGKPPARLSTPGFAKTAFGAFIDVHALGAVALFAAVLRRIGSILGGKYLDNILEMLDTAAVNVERALSALQVYVPKVAAVTAVFALAAWTTAFLRKLAALSRFCVGRNGGYITVTSGLITLYEHILVRNSAAIIFTDSPISLAAKRSPVYMRGVMIYPCAAKAHRNAGFSAAPPARALLGYCAAPLTWGGVFTTLLIIIYISGKLRGAMLLRTALWCGLIVSLYSAAVFLYYMKYSGMTLRGGIRKVTARRFMRLYTVTLNENIVTSRTISQNVFQRRSGLCNFKMTAAELRGAKKLKIRLVPKNEIDQY